MNKEMRNALENQRPSPGVREAIKTQHTVKTAAFYVDLTDIDKIKEYYLTNFNFRAMVIIEVYWLFNNRKE